MSLDGQLANAFQLLQNSINQTFQTISGNALVVNGGGGGGVSGGEFIRKWTYVAGNSDTPATGTFTVATDSTYITVNNSDTDGDALRWLNSLHGLLTNSLNPVLLSMTDNTPVATIASAFVVTSMEFGTTELPYTKIYGDSINVAEPFATVGAVDFIFTLEGTGGASGASGSTAVAGTNYSWTWTTTEPPPAGTVLIPTGAPALVFNSQTTSGIDSLPWFENVLDVVNGYTTTTTSPVTYPPTDVLFTLSNKNGLFIEFRLIQN